jgi:hypothetical protein
MVGFGTGSVETMGPTAVMLALLVALLRYNEVLWGYQPGQVVER